MVQESRSALGTLVSVRQDHWRVLDIVRHDDCESWQLEGIRPVNRGERRTLLVPFDRPRPLARGSGMGRGVGRRRGLLALRALLALSAGAGQLRSAASATMEILDYQLEPALACLLGASRILIADEVGLGKTVQAALILAELASRGEAARVLVLAPATLVEQWSDELSHRFRVEPTIVERAALARLAAWSSEDEGPWARLPLAIASIDYVKQPEILRGMAGVRWDLLIVDEAHACVQAPYRAAALGWIARRSRRVVLLTATPHPGKDEAFRALCEVGRFPGEPPVTMFRRTRAALGGPPTRRVRVVRVPVGEAEARMHWELIAYARRVWSCRSAIRPIAPARLAMIVLCKRAASGPIALLASLARRLELLAQPASPPAVQLSLPLVENLDGEDEPPDVQLGVQGLDDETQERRELERLMTMAREASADDTKTRALRRLLARARQPAVVFTEYRDTLEGLSERLAPIGELVTLHGGLDRADRRAAIARFTSGRAAILLATDAASLGLNLQGACRLVVNYDLPWSPMRLEQRIGRLDRIGQRRVVHAFHLAARGTFEDEVLSRLALRVEAVRRSIGLGASPLGTVDEARVAETVIGGENSIESTAEHGAGIADVVGETSCRRGEVSGAGVEAANDNRESFISTNLRAEARAEAGRLLVARALSSPRRAAAHAPDLGTILADCERTAPWRFALRATRTSLAPGVYVLYRARVVDGRGALLHDEVIPLFLPQTRVDGMAAGTLAALSWRQVAPPIEALVRKVVDARLAEVDAVLQAGTGAQRLRETRMLDIDGREPEPVQAGLFDRRALKAADSTASHRRAMALESSARLRALAGAGRPAIASPPEPLLVVLVAGGRRPHWR